MQSEEAILSPSCCGTTCPQGLPELRVQEFRLWTLDSARCTLESGNKHQQAAAGALHQPPSHYHTTTTTLPRYHTTTLQHYHYHATTLPHDHTTTRPHYHTTTLPHDHTTTRPHYPYHHHNCHRTTRSSSAHFLGSLVLNGLGSLGFCGCPSSQASANSKCYFGVIPWTADRGRLVCRRRRFRRKRSPSPS